MPRKWTNADTYAGGGRSLTTLLEELRRNWASRQQDAALTRFRNTYTHGDRPVNLTTAHATQQPEGGTAR